MNTTIESIVRNAHLLVDRQSVEPITKTNPYLYNVSHLCVTNRELMGQIPAEDCGYMAFAYINILDLTDEPSVFQIYSTICYYFTEKALLYGYVGPSSGTPIHVSTLNTAIINMNIGAQSLCRTFAQAQGIVPNNYIDYSNLEFLPIYVKQILLCEYSYFVEFEKIIRPVRLKVPIEIPYQLAIRYSILCFVIHPSNSPLIIVAVITANAPLPFLDHDIPLCF